MLSVLDHTGKRTAGVALRHSLYLLPIGFAATALDVAKVRIYIYIYIIYGGISDDYDRQTTYIFLFFTCLSI